MNDFGMHACILCPHRCGTDRHMQQGVCGATDKIRVNIHQLHYWEEPVISGTQGSGTIFFSHCNLKCVFCQNFQISQAGHGQDISIERLAEMMLELQEKNAHNINLVTPTHYSLPIREALILAKKRGLEVPVVWNSNAYENVETLRMLEGLIDIYLPDFKYGSDDAAQKYSGIRNYTLHAKKSILEMYRQTGHLKIHEGIAYCGLMIRMLILPEEQSHYNEIFEWIAENTGVKTYISLMGQYYPTYRAHDFPMLSRGITPEEYSAAVTLMDTLGFQNGFIQDVGSSSRYTPDFSKHP